MASISGADDSWRVTGVPPPPVVDDPIAARLGLDRLLRNMFGMQGAGSFDRYVPLSDRGVEGGMSVVYPAWDRQCCRDVALKVLKTGGDRSTSLLLREARMLSKVSHPNVVAIYDAGALPAIGGRSRSSFLVMEWVEGQTLGRWAQTQPDWRDVLRAYLQAGAGIAASHAQGVVHGDIKPSNLLRGVDGRTCVIDFGLAMFRGRVGESMARNAPWGTPRYMAPEQHQGRVDCRSDQFCYCATLYEALAGVLPFGSGSLEELALAQQRSTLNPPREGVPVELLRLLQRGLRSDPKERYPSMGALLVDLAGFLLS